MEDALGVGGLERVGDLPARSQDLVHRERRAHDALLEGLARDELEDEEADGVELLEAVDRRDVRVVQGREDVRLAREAREAVRVLREGVREDLDRDVALQARVARAPHLAHPSRSEPRKDLERSEAGTRFERHGAATIIYNPASYARFSRTFTSSALLVLAAAGRAAAADPPGAAFFDAWPAARVYTGDPFALKSAALRAEIARLLERHPGLFRVAEEGVSAEGRAIPLLVLGDGPEDRPPLVADARRRADGDRRAPRRPEHLGETRETPATKALLSKLTLAVIPMLNPDGAERTRRTNAQGIDINRDALRLQTPEGRFLKAVRDRLKPAVGYNLHNQGPNTLSGPSGRAGGDRAPRRSVRRGVHGERGPAHDEAARRPRPRPPAAVGAGARLALRHGVHGAGLRRLDDALGHADAPHRVGRLRGCGRRRGRGARAAQLRRAPRHAVRARGRFGRGRGRGGVRRDPAERARPALRRRRPPRPRDRGRRPAAVPRGRRLERPASAARASPGPPSAAGGAERVLDLGDLETYKGKTEIDATNLVLAVAPKGGAEGWAKALEGLKAKGLATPDGTLTLPLAALSQEAKAWLDGAPALAPGYGGDFLAPRARRETGRFRVERRLVRREPLGPRRSSSHAHARTTSSTYSGRRIPARTTSTPGVASERAERALRERARGRGARPRTRT